MFNEKHYSVKDLSSTWGLSTRTVHRLFAKERVLCIEAEDKTGKRRYRTIRIPHSLMEEVYARYLNSNQEKPKSTPSEEERYKIRARRKVAYAINHGRMVRLPCEICGETETDAHHDDYDRPLSVRWLCKPHHRECHTPHGAATQ